MKSSQSPGNGPASSDTLRQQAWEWLRRLTAEDVSHADMQGFRQWVQAHPAHQAAYKEVKVRWDSLKPSAGRLLREQPGMIQAYERAQRARTRQRRAFLGLAAASAGAVAVALVHPPLDLWPAASEWGADYRTAAGEQRAVAVSPGVQVTLNTRTSLRRALVDGRVVGVDLLAGEAAVELAGGYRFTVTAGVGRSQAQTGQFEVRHLDGRVCVTCIAGATQVIHPAGARVLHAHQQMVYDDLAAGSPVDIDPEMVSAWQRGVLVFRQAPLAQVIDEINRYRTSRIVLMNAAARSQAVTGSFEIAALDRAVAQLQYMFDLRARSLPGGVLILA
ncbi:FecR domain-containing protein [Orrella sp. JC864]|uniref:FecR family protein n=1 Tax=Orrella sp. JC864 TaxID=3120298 RepID=UPI0030098BEB